MVWVLDQEQRPLLAVFGATLLVTATIGLRVGGQRGMMTAVGGVVIGALTIGLLSSAIVHTFEDSPVDWSVVLAGAVLVVGGLVLVQYKLLSNLGNTAELAFVAVIGATVGAGVGFVGTNGVVRGGGHGLLAGALGGLLFVPIATFESFTMEPASNVIVLLSGVVGPLVIGILGGIGGIVGGSLHSIPFTSGISD